jgi:hypothetical protein
MSLTRRLFMLSLCAAPVAARAQIALTFSDYNLIFAPVEVNGRAATALVDTGSVRGVQLSQALQRDIDLRADERAGTNQRYDGGGRAVFAGLADSFALGTFRAENQPVQVIPGDIEQISREVGTPFDVILGWPLLARFDFALDYRARTLQLDAAPDANAWRIPLEAGKNLPVVSAKLGGTPALLLVDTGAPMSNLDISATQGTANSLVTQPLELAGRSQPLAFRVKDLTPIRRGLGCTAVLGNNFFAGRTLAYIRQVRSFALS